MAGQRTPHDPEGLEKFYLSAVDVRQIRQGLKLLAKELEKCAKQESEKCGLSSSATLDELANILGHDDVVGLLQRFAPQVDAFERQTGVAEPQFSFAG